MTKSLTKEKRNENSSWVFVAGGKGHTPLIGISGIPYGYKKGYLGKFLGMNFNPSYYRRLANISWYNQQEWEQYLDIIKKIFQKNPQKLISLGEKWENLILLYEKTLEDFNQKDFSFYSHKDLLKTFEKFYENFAKIVSVDHCGYAINIILSDKLFLKLSKKIHNPQELNKAIEICTSVDKKLATIEARKNLILLAQRIKKGKIPPNSEKLKLLVRQFLKKYPYLGNYFFVYSPYTEKEILKRLKTLEKKNLKKELQKIKEGEENIKRVQEIIHKFQLDKKTQIIIKALKQWGYVANLFNEILGSLTTQKTYKLFSEIASRLGITYKMLVEMSFEEINLSLREGKKISSTFKKDLKERMKDFGFIYAKGELTILSSQELKEEKSKIKTTSLGTVSQIKGQCAYVGKVRGRVRLILDKDQIGQMKKGEILVARSTAPIFVPAMEKANAIITDEGGLLCHAAVVSRELKIPCIVGTKIATKVLKDGDEVEVDANEGIVKIINK